MSVKVVRMLSGEDILCVCEDQDDTIEIKDGVVIVPTQNQSVQFVPYSPFTTKDPIQLNKDMVVFVADPDKSLQDQHKKMFGGIITPESSIIA
jgi:hypothetical protein